MVDTIEIRNEAMIQEMLRDAKVQEIPDDLTQNPVIHKGDVTLEAPMVVKSVTSAGYVYVWDTRTFEKIPILYYMLPAKMREKRPDGSPRFTATEPKEQPWRGKIKCLLHKDDPDRKSYDALGLTYCTKSNLLNVYERSRHMKMKHPKEWETIENGRKEKERLEDRQLQRAIIEKVTEARAMESFPCDMCDKVFSSRIALEGHKRSHK